jgi:hypothetical protein
MKKTIVLALSGLGLLLGTTVASAQVQTGYFSGLSNFNSEKMSPSGYSTYTSGQKKVNVNKLDNASGVNWSEIKRQLSKKRFKSGKIR